MASEEELFARLSNWLKTQTGPISVFTAMETGDSELVAAYVLVMFRAAARHAVLDRFGRVVGSIATSVVGQGSNVVFRLFGGLAQAWRLSEAEQQSLLGLAEVGDVERSRALPEADVPIELIERVAILLDIFTAINAILQNPELADAWVRRPSKASLFSGKSPLEFMMEGGLAGLRSVRSYLWSNL